MKTKRIINEILNFLLMYKKFMVNKLILNWLIEYYLIYLKFNLIIE